MSERLHLDPGVSRMLISHSVANRYLKVNAQMWWLEGKVEGNGENGVLGKTLQKHTNITKTNHATGKRKEGSKLKIIQYHENI